MQITVVCVACAKRYLTDDSSLEKGMICPACGGAMKSAPQLNLKKPSKSHLETYDPLWTDTPVSGGSVPTSASDPAKKVLVYGLSAVAVAFLVGMAWIMIGKMANDSPPVVAKPAKPVVKPAENEPAVEVAETPVFAPAAPRVEQPKRVKKSVAELLEAEGDGVVHITVFDGHGKPYGTGSGMVIARRPVDEWIEPEVKSEQGSPKGDLWLVATNYHVVAGSSGASVRLRDGTTRAARGLAAFDRDRDLAILALDDAPPKLKVLEPVAGDLLRQGEEVLAIGHPKGFDITISTGIISAVRSSQELPEDVAETVHAPADQQWLQTTAAITGGNSGGPLLTMLGEVVGLNTWGLETAGNVAFASHVKHLMELNKTTVEVDAEKKRSKVRVRPFTAAKSIDAPEQIGGKSDWRESEVRDELARSAKRAVDIDWRPTTKGDYVAFQATATMLTIAAVQRFDVPEVKQLSESIGTRQWNFETEVRQINRYAIENLDEGQWGVFLFGKIRRINAATRRNLWVDLTGRGYVVAVTIPANQPVPELKVGDDLAVLGYRVGLARENSRLPRGVHDILAGLVLPITLPTVPDDTALQAARDLVKYDREDQGFGEFARKFADRYERVIPMLGKTSLRWQRLSLNAGGRQFDAVRFSVPPGLNGDLLWSFNSPENAIEEWGVMPVGDFPMRVVGNTHTFRDIPAPGLTKDESQHVTLQCVTGGLLVPGEDYLLWFTYRDAEPRRMAIAVRVVPTGSFNPADPASIGLAMRDGTAFKPEELNRMQKAIKDKAAAEPKPNATGTPTAIGTGS